MFGLKINKHTVRRAFNNTKSFIGDSYHKAKGFLGDLDAGINTAKSIYSIIQPAMTSLLGDTHTNVANKYVMKNLNNYESIRSRVMDFLVCCPYANSRMSIPRTNLRPTVARPKFLIWL